MKVTKIRKNGNDTDTRSAIMNLCTEYDKVHNLINQMNKTYRMV